MSQRLSDNFDNSIRRIADEADTPFHEESWAAMEKLLDKRKRRMIPLWWYWGGGALAGFILATILFFHDHKKFQIDPAQDPRAISTTSAINDWSYALHLIKAQIIKYDKTLHPEHVLIYSNHEKNRSTIRSAPGDYTLSGLHNRSHPDPTIHESIQLSNSNPKANEMPDEPSDVKVSVNESVIQDTRREWYEVGLIPFMTGKLFFDRNIVIPSGPLKQSGNFKSEEISYRRGLFAGIVFSPHNNEKTAVDIKDRPYGKSNEMYGLDVGYQLSKRLSVSTGIHYTKRYYDAYEGDYENDNYLKNYKILKVNAACGIVDIPIHLNYHVVQWHGTSLILHAGILSQQMRNENYGYHFNDPWGKYGFYTKTFATNHIGLFTAGTVGFGLQQKIGHHLALSLNPYYNYSLKGVGEGNVRLKSSGSTIALHYLFAN